MANEKTQPAAAKPAPGPAKAISQTLPAGQVAPAAPAAKVKAPKRELTAEQIALKKTMDEARAKFNAAIGKEPKSRSGVSRTSGTGLLKGDLQVTVNMADSFTKDTEKGIPAAIGTGKTLAEVLKLDNFDYARFRYHLIRNHLKLNGKLFSEAFN